MNINFTKDGESLAVLRLKDLDLKGVRHALYVMMMLLKGVEVEPEEEEFKDLILKQLSFIAQQRE